MRNTSIQAMHFNGSDGLQYVGNIYNLSANVYNASCNIIIEKNCFSYQFTNIGDTIATVNGQIIFPSATPLTSLGDSRAISAHKLDIFKGNITLAFDAVAPGTNPAVEIVQLFYAESYI